MTKNFPKRIAQSASTLEFLPTTPTPSQRKPDLRAVDVVDVDTRRADLNKEYTPMRASLACVNSAQLRPIKKLSPLDALHLLIGDSRAMFIDVRSDLEFLLIGHALPSRCIPWIEDGAWEVNPHFIAQVSAIATFDTPIVLICRSGDRSAAATAALQGAGFSDVYDVAGGFEGESDNNQHRSTQSGWRYFGLPWEQC